MASQIPQVLRATAKPVLSSSFTEARRRALNLYRAWYREVRLPLSLSLSLQTPSSSLQIPHTIELYLLDIPVQQARQKLREQFYKNAHVRDPRVIDMLVIKVQSTIASSPGPSPPGKGPGTHRLRMCKITSKISVKVSMHYNLPRGTLTSNSNKKLGKSISCPLPANRPNERFAFA